MILDWGVLRLIGDFEYGNADAGFVMILYTVGGLVREQFVCLVLLCVDSEGRNVCKWNIFR